MAANTKMPKAAEGFEFERFYTLRDTAAVRRLAGQEPSLPPLLEEAAEQIAKYFPEAQAVLRTSTYPAIEEDEQLVVGIATDLAPVAARERLKQFDFEWWLKALPRAKGKLCIKLEYR